MAKNNDLEVLKKKTMTKKAYLEEQKRNRQISGFNTATRDTDKNGKTRHNDGLSVSQKKHKNLRPENMF